MVNSEHMDNVLLRRLAKGNVEAYELLFHAYYPSLIAYCKQFVGIKQKSWGG